MQEKDLLVSRGAGVSHCANSNYSINSGIADVVGLLRHGVKVRGARPCCERTAQPRVAGGARHGRVGRVLALHAGRDPQGHRCGMRAVSASYAASALPLLPACRSLRCFAADASKTVFMARAGLLDHIKQSENAPCMPVCCCCALDCSSVALSAGADRLQHTDAAPRSQAAAKLGT